MDNDAAMLSQELTEFQQRQHKFAARFNLSLDEYLRIMRVSTTEEAVVILELLKVRKHRSSYRSKAHEQVRRWLDLNLSGKPLHPTQYVLIAPTWPILWAFPTH